MLTSIAALCKWSRLSTLLSPFPFNQGEFSRALLVPPLLQQAPPDYHHNDAAAAAAAADLRRGCHWLRTRCVSICPYYVSIIEYLINTCTYTCTRAYYLHLFANCMLRYLPGSTMYRTSGRNVHYCHCLAELCFQLHSCR